MALDVQNGIERLGNAGARVVSKAVDGVSGIFTGALSMLFPSGENDTLDKWIGKGVQGTAETVGGVATAALNEIPQVAIGTVEVVGGTAQNLASAVHVPNSEAALLSGQNPSGVTPPAVRRR